MKRKALAITLAAAMAMGTCAVTASAADGDKYTIGICQLVQHEALDAATQGFKDEVTKELGEDAVTFDEQNAQGDSNTCSTIINSFVSNNVDLILANATPALQAAAAGTSDIPILGTSVTEYGVALGLDDFNGTVGGNISGTADLAPLDQQAAMLNELFPDAKNVGLLYCSAEANSQYQVDTVKAELEKLGYTCEYYAFSDSNDLSSVATTATDASDVIYVPTDNTVASNTEIINNITKISAKSWASKFRTIMSQSVRLLKTQKRLLMMQRQQTNLLMKQQKIMQLKKLPNKSGQTVEKYSHQQDFK
jgi:putative ABC transport system substrate-binding protein